MIVFRSAQKSDLSDLEYLAQQVYFINLPRDRKRLEQMLSQSEKSFKGEAKDKAHGYYIFVCEMDGKVVGTSLIHAQHGTPEEPHFYFEVGNEQRYSETIKTGFVHGTIRLKWDTDGPTEVGGLVLDPNLRRHPEKLGRSLSFIRFMYMALHKDRFKRRIHTELMPPMDEHGQPPLWEALGRRFTNMDYFEADMLSRKNLEFITSLFPSGKIYTTFLSAEARDAIGKVGKDTEPVLHLMTRIGFRYVNQVDPFDGGPHLQANIDEIMPVTRTVSGKYLGPLEKGVSGTLGLVAVKSAQGLQALRCRFHVYPGQGIRTDAVFPTAVKISSESVIVVTPFE